jgi:hypothetical protein
MLAPVPLNMALMFIMHHFYPDHINILTPSNSAPCSAYGFPLSPRTTSSKTPLDIGVSPLQADNGKQKHHENRKSLVRFSWCSAITLHVADGAT